MHAFVRRPLILLWLLLPLLAAGTGLAIDFARDELAIETASGARYRFDVELALTPEQQARGLMNRPSMPADAGMLFVFPEDRPASFWMKNTLIPLDMLFIERDGRIESIRANAVPLSTDTVSSEGPVAAVLELNGGLAAKLGIRPGDRVIHSAFE